MLRPIDVTVQGMRPSRYQARQIDLGPLGQRKPLETPFALSVIRNDLIVEQDLRTPEDMIRMVPSAQIEARGSTEWGRPQVRGFQADVTGNTRIDGFAAMAPTAQPVEMYDRMEVLYGPAAALYGVGSPAGQFNAILKRPTERPLRRLHLGYLSNSAFVFHADFGGRGGEEGMFGYRANLALSDGERYVDGASMRRELASLVVDARVTKHTVVEGVVGGYLLDQRGYPGGFSYGAGASTRLPAAQDPTRLGFGQKYTGTLGKTGFFELRARQQIAHGWHLVAGLAHQRTGREFRSLTNTLSDNVGSYSARVRETADAQRLTGNQVYLHGRFGVQKLSHEIHVGTNGSVLNGQASKRTGQYALGNATLDSPELWPEPQWAGTGGMYDASRTMMQSLVAGYTMTLFERLHATAIGSMTWIRTQNHANPAAAGTAGAPGAGAGAESTYDANAIVAPTFALGYKPTPRTFAYANYGMGVMPGPMAPATAANPNETLAPYRSHQYEVGFKAEVPGVTLTTALFRIERPFAYVDPDDKVFRNQGQQVNHGAEAGIAGRVARDLVVYGGLTLIDPRLRDTAKAATSDKLVVGVPRWQGNVVVDYELPFLRDLVSSFVLHYTGVRAATETNRSWAQEYATVDTSLRYGFRVKASRLVARVAIRNLLNERYWVSIFPGSINGDSANYTAFLGAPRTYEASLRLDL
ncbi:MAG TPA: TonB-dependent receptor [Polyangiaceae bacterium]|nr:TonB-dependent receptor [Polyangiaceae bacterium]